ncbi:hypothetical protein [Nonomuraea lactucae]|nr:hypothetical protein [Nonomuraea lactucae]
MGGEIGDGRYAEVAKWMREGCATVLAAGEDRAYQERPKVDVVTTALP